SEGFSDWPVIFHTRDQRGEVFCPERGLQRAGKSQLRLDGGSLGLAAQASSLDEGMASPQFTRLSQARGHLRARQVFVKQVHLSAPYSVGVHVWSSPAGQRAPAPMVITIVFMAVAFRR
ncbi:hypothetical protein ACFU7D_27970, partial [Nocardioides sp. NPDC057577]|uniref:hypothetical protein n=1 Tax=Nocardioides sp. NPDC057577 TaxID=3346171 RepID=UPI00366B5EC7